MATTPSLIHGSTLVVPSSQADHYSAAHPANKVMPVVWDGLAAAVNQILEVNESEWLVILDDDLVGFRHDGLPIAPESVISGLVDEALKTGCKIAGTRRVGRGGLPEFSFNEPMTQLLVVRNSMSFRVDSEVHGYWWMDLICQCVEAGERTLRWNWVRRSFKNPVITHGPSLAQNRKPDSPEIQYCKRVHPMSQEWFARGW